MNVQCSWNVIQTFPAIVDNIIWQWWAVCPMIRNFHSILNVATIRSIKVNEKKRHFSASACPLSCGSVSLKAVCTQLPVAGGSTPVGVRSHAGVVTSSLARGGESWERSCSWPAEHRGGRTTKTTDRKNFPAFVLWLAGSERFTRPWCNFLSPRESSLPIVLLYKFPRTAPERVSAHANQWHSQALR